MSISKKLYAGFGAVILFLIISSILAFVQLNKVNDQYTFLVDDRVHKLLLAGEILNASSLQGVYVRSYMLAPSDKTITNLHNQQKIVDDISTELESIVSTQDMLNEVNKIKENQAIFEQAANDVIGAIDANDLQQAINIMLETGRPANERIQVSINKIKDYQVSEVERIKKTTTDSAHFSSLLLIIIAVISTIVAAFIALFITRAITIPVNKLANAAEIIANGDLSQEDIQVSTKDEIRHLANSFNTMKTNLRSLIASVAANVEQTTAAAEQLSASTDQVAFSSNEVAKSVEVLADTGSRAATTGHESSMAMEETAQGVQRIAEATQNLLSKAVDTQTVATEGGQTLQTAEKQMAIIQQSSYETNERIKQLSIQSTEIENITKVITDITEQTNLLALNAAIEAARAGEHGKGFAVVADEVRKLAEESKKSANQIVGLTTLIQQDTREVEKAVSVTVENVEQGVHFIQDAKTAFTSIMGSVREMTTQIEEVSASTEEISASTQEVSASVNEMASAANQTSHQSNTIAAAIEEQTATIHEINSVAKSLTDNALTVQQEINQFKV